MSVAAALQRARAAAPAAGDDPGLGEAVAALLARARAAWPDLAVPADVFLDYVGERLPPEELGPAGLARLHVEDLYLACGCVRGDRAALAAFERSFMARISAYLGRSDALPAFTDEVKQTLRARLLVGDADVRPRLARYAGRGPLGAWLWMSATRVAIDLRRASGQAENDTRLALLADRTVPPDPELAHLKQRYKPVFREAFREVLGALPHTDGALLRLHFLEGLTTEQLGTLLGVSRWTAGREVARVCRHVLKETRRLMATRLDLSTGQLDSLMRLLRSELSVGVAEVLGADPDR
jgi:RNA polymerase sigma-70 factor (ECF subfamily)